MRFLLATAALTSLLAGCGAAMARDTVRQRASYDLSCSSKKVKVRNIGGTSYAAEGCGAKAVYNCTENGRTCVREAQTERSSP